MRGVFILSLFALVPAAVLAFLRPAGRRALMVLGLLAVLSAQAVLDMGGADNPLVIVQLIPAGVVAGGMLVEIGAFMAARVRARRGTR